MVGVMMFGQDHKGLMPTLFGLLVFFATSSSREPVCRQKAKREQWDAINHVTIIRGTKIEATCIKYKSTYLLEMFKTLTYWRYSKPLTYWRCIFIHYGLTLILIVDALI